MLDLHMHSVFSDGKNTAEEMILSAVRLGLDCVGLSEHSHTVGDECGMTPEGTLAYRIFSPTIPWSMITSSDRFTGSGWETGTACRSTGRLKN